MITRTNIENDKTDNNIENDNVVIDIENADEVGQRMHLRDPEVAISNSNACHHVPSPAFDGPVKFGKE